MAVAAIMVLAACGGGGGNGDSAGTSNNDASTDEASVSVDATGGDPASTTDIGSLIVDDEIDNNALNALVTDFAALDADAQSDRVNELSGEVERQMYDLSGLAQELGSPEAVDDSIGKQLNGSLSSRSKRRAVSARLHSNPKASAVALSRRLQRRVSA